KPSGTLKSNSARFLFQPLLWKPLAKVRKQNQLNASYFPKLGHYPTTPCPSLRGDCCSRIRAFAVPENPMSRVCQVTGKKPMKGHLVSHANNKTIRTFQPNLHYRRFWVESQNRWVRLRVSTAGLRRIDKLGVEAVLAEIKAKAKAGAYAGTMGEALKLDS